MFRRRVQSVTIAIFVLTIGLWKTQIVHAQMPPDLVLAYQGERESYRRAIERAAGDVQRVKTEREAYRSRLRRLLDDVVAREERSLRDSSTAAIIAAELGAWDTVVRLVNRELFESDTAAARILIDAHLRVGESEIAEDLFRQLRARQKSSNEFGALHAAFANAYEKANRRDRAAAHLDAFAHFVLDSISSNPSAARLIPGLIERHRRLSESLPNEQFLSSIQRQLETKITEMEKPNAPSSSGSIAGGGTVFGAAVSLSAQLAWADPSGLLGRWTQYCRRVISSGDVNPTVAYFIVNELLLGIAKYSFLLRNKESIERLGLELDAVVDSFDGRFDDRMVEAVRARVHETKARLDSRIAHLRCEGMTLTSDELLQIGIKGANEAGKRLTIICLWSPFVSQAATVLPSIEQLVARHPTARLFVALPYRENDDADPQRRALRDQALSQLQMKLQSTEGQRIELVSASLAVLKRLQMNVLPQVVVIDEHSTVRGIVVGNDNDRLLFLDRLLSRLESRQADSGIQKWPRRNSPTMTPRLEMCARPRPRFAPRWWRFRRR